MTNREDEYKNWPIINKDDQTSFIRTNKKDDKIIIKNIDLNKEDEILEFLKDFHD